MNQSETGSKSKTKNLSITLQMSVVIMHALLHDDVSEVAKIVQKPV